MLDANGLFNKDALEADFFSYAANFISNKQKERIDTNHYERAVKYLQRWVGEYCKFRHIDENFLISFKDYLLNTISLKSKFSKLNQNSAALTMTSLLTLYSRRFLMAT